MRHRRSLVAVTAVLAALLVACDSSPAVPTSSSTTVSPVTTPQPSSGAPPTTRDPALSAQLPTDPRVVSGALDNGLSYYVQENDSPGGRAELRLLVDAGSVQEDPGQEGVAHFLEHMMFNGTERFPRNQLISVLERFGPRFGPDINAYTSFDETVYELSLSSDDELVQLGIEVLREWATRATLTESDVVAERGVVLDEWRLRAQGFGARVNDHLEDLILPGTVYEGRLPIGTEDSIRAMSPAALRRFYDDWYRPERMTVVAVGDFDADVMVSRIVDAFSDIPPDDDPRDWNRGDFSPPEQARVGSFTDEEATGGGVTVIWSVPAAPVQTVGDYQRRAATSMGIQILSTRLSDDALVGDGPLLGASAVDVDWTRAISLLGIEARVRAEGVDDGLVAVLDEVERLRRHGITEEEFERALTGFETATRQRLEQADSTQDSEYTARIVAHHLDGAPLMSPEQRFEIESGVAGRLTKEAVGDAILSIVEGSPGILVLGPDDVGLDIPSEERVREALAAMPSVDLEPREDIDPGDVDLMEVPEPATIVASSVDPQLDYTTLVFDNGAEVYLWESDIAAGAVYARVEGFGGTSVVALDDLTEAWLMTDIVARSGVGDIDVPTLQRLLSDRVVGVHPWISETRQGLEASSATGDVETLFQLIHLTMVEPRFDAVAVEAVLDETNSLAAARDDLPGVLFEEAVNQAYYGDDPRYFVVPSSEQLARFDVEDAEDVYEDRFGDAGDFAFVFVGDFDTESMADLSARYIGTLPGDPGPSRYVDNQPLPPREVQVTTVEAGTGDQGQLGMFFTNEFESTPADEVAARLTELILGARLRDKIREELSATYSISTSIDLQLEPDAFAESSVISSGDPAGLVDISKEVLAEIASLQGDGPTESQFATAVEQMRDELALIDNGTIADRLITAHLYPDRPMSGLGERLPILEQMTIDDVREMAAIAYNLDQRIEVRLIPRP